MLRGAITGYIDVAQVTLYAFWIFFAGLIIYLRREDRREGYPLEAEIPSDDIARRASQPPSPKTFRLMHGGVVYAPPGAPLRREIRAERSEAWPGAPYLPTGNPMLDGVGPGSWCEREDAPELLIDGKPTIAPMRVTGETSVAFQDVDPRGMPVLAADKKVAGVVTDLWVDHGEPQIRYLEVALEEGGRHVLLPIGFASIAKRARQVRCRSIFAAQFADVPSHKAEDSVTKLEEDKIVAYFASGYLYGKASRAEPLL